MKEIKGGVVGEDFGTITNCFSKKPIPKYPNPKDRESMIKLAEKEIREWKKFLKRLKEDK